MILISKRDYFRSLSFIIFKTRKIYLNDSYILELIGALAQSKTKKQVNADLKQIEKVINMLRITGTFAKGDTKKELNAYIKSLQSQLSHIKLTAKIDSKNLKREVDKALNGISFKDIDALNIDENKTKLKIRKIIADAKAYAEKSPITVNIESKKNKLNNDLTAYLNRNTKISESSVLLKEAERVRELINAIGDKKTLREATDAFQLYKSEVSATGFNTKSTTDKIKDMLGHVSKISSAFGVASIAVNNFVKSLKTLKYNDTILTEISKTSEMTKQQLRGLGDEAFKTASKYGQLSSNYLIAVQEMARSGYEETSKELGKLSLLAQSAGDMTAESANNYLLATDAAYKYGGSIEKLNAALDGANYISNKNSATLTDIADATRVSASFAANAGVAIDELTAAEATMLAVTKRGGSEIGRAFRSIVLNLQQVSGEFDGEIIDEEQLKKVEARCHSLGVELEYMKDGIATLRNPIEVLKELAEVYNSLPDNSAEKQGLISDLGGKYHANALSSLLSRWDLYEKMLGEFSQGTGSALEEAEKTADSWEGRLNSLSNTFTSFVNVITNKDTILNGISFFDRLIQGAETLIDIVGEVPVVLTAVNSSLVAMNKDYGITQLVNKDTGKFDIQGNLLGIDFSTIKEQKKHFKEAEDAITIWNNKLKNGKNDLEAFNYAVVQNNAQLKDYLSTTSKDAPASLSGYKAHLNAAGVSTDALRLKTILLNSAISMGIGFAIQAVVQGITYLIQREEELRQATQEAANAYKESASSIEDYTKRYQELRQALIEAKGNEEETYNIKQQLLDLQTELNDKFGEEYGKLNLVTDAYKDQTEAIKAYNKEAAQTFLNENRKGIKQSEKEMTKERHYNLSPVNISAFTKEGEALKEIAEQFKDQGVSLLDELGDGSYNQFSVHLNTDVQSAYDTINEFENAVREKAEELGNEHLFDDILDISSVSVNDAKSVLDDWGDIYQQSLMAEIAKDDTLTSQMNEAAKAVQEYNEAVLSSEDPFNDESVQKAQENLNALKAEMQKDDGSWNAKWQKYASVIEDVFNQADTRLIDFDNAVRNDTAIQELANKLKGLDNLDIQGIVDSMDGANRLQGVAAQFANITSQSDEVKNAVAELIHYADEYGLETEELIDALTRLGYVQGEVASSTENVSNTFAGWDALNEQIDSIQSSYKAIQAAQEEYNQYGYVSMDTLQALISLDSEYLACLIDENGQLQLNSATYQQLVQAKLAEAEATAISQAMTELQAIANGEAAASTVDYITGNAELMKSLALLTGQYSNVANAAMTAAQAQALSAAIESANGIDSAATEKVMANLNAKLALIQNTAQKTTSSFGGLNNAVNGFSNAQKGAGKATKDTNDALKEQKEALEAEKEALQEQKEAAEDALQAQIDGIDDIIKGKEKEIDALDDEIDKIKEAREERKRDLDLQKAQYDWARMQNQRPKLLYTEEKGMHYVPDTSGIRDKREKIAELKEDAEIANLEKKKDLIQDEIDALEEQKDLIRDMIDESNEYYDNLIKQVEKSITELSKGADEAGKAASNAAGNVGSTIGKLRDTLSAGKTLSYYIWTAQDETALTNAKFRIKDLEALIERHPEESRYVQLKDDVTRFAEELEKLKDTRLVTDDFTDSLNALKNSEDGYLRFFKDTIAGVEERVNNTANYSDKILETVSHITTRTSELKNTLDGVQISSNEKIKESDDIAKGVGENINRLTGSVADAVMRVSNDTELLNGSVGGISDAVMRVTENTSTGFNNLATDMSNTTASISESANTVNSALDSISDSERFDNLTTSFSGLGEAILGVSEALGISEEGTVGGLVSAITAINEISLGGEEGGIIGQFHNLKMAVDGVSAAIAGGGGSQGSAPNGNGSSSGSGNKGSGASVGTNSGASGGSNSVTGSLEQLLQTADKTLGNGGESDSSEDDGTVIGKFGILKNAVNAVAEAIGLEEGAEGDETLISALMAEFNTASEVLPQEEQLFNELQASIQACVNALHAMIEALKEINSLGVPGSGGSVSTGPAHAKGTVGNAFATGTGYRGLPEAEKNALRSENGQLELTLYPDGTTEITNKPIMSDLPKGTIIFNEDQTKQILNGKPYMRGKINSYGVANFENDVIVRPSGEVLHPLPEDHPIIQAQKKFEAYVQKMGGGIETVLDAAVTSMMNERNKEVDKFINQLNAGNVITNNKNVQPNINNEFHITMPNVTNSTAAETLMRDLQSLSIKKYQAFD